MRSALITFVLIQLARSVAGENHHFFTGAFSGGDVFLMEFDDLSDTLTLLANESTVGDTTKWISFDVCALPWIGWYWCTDLCRHKRRTSM